MSRNHTKLTSDERDQLAVLKASGMGVRAIARELGRSPSTISDELKRNSHGPHYVAIHAQALTQERKQEARKRHPLKNSSVYKYVIKKLRDGWSPEQISGRLKLKKPDNPYWHIGHETIYRFIYAKGNQHKKLWEFLPRKQKKRKQQSGRKVHSSRIPDRVSIHVRPEEINTR
ncbi:MAG: IS30 family transposase [Caldilineaceae bacterium]